VIGVKAGADSSVESVEKASRQQGIDTEPELKAKDG
jgi:hypothetical protein